MSKVENCGNCEESGMCYECYILSMSEEDYLVWIKECEDADLNRQIKKTFFSGETL